MAQFTFKNGANRMYSYIRECRSRNDTVTEDETDESDYPMAGPGPPPVLNDIEQGE